jgi:hypothetical protein
VPTEAIKAVVGLEVEERALATQCCTISPEHGNHSTTMTSDGASRRDFLTGGSEYDMGHGDSGPLPFETPHAELRRLRAENAQLRQLLAAHGVSIPSPLPQQLLREAHPSAVTTSASEETTPHGSAPVALPVPVETGGQDHHRRQQQIALFRRFFHGRDDVYARRWQSADGRSGYMPASLKDWNAINRSRPEDRRKVDQATRKLLPLTDAVVEAHLSGRETIGVYPLLPDETCFFLAVDFDKKTWADDACAFVAICQELGVPAALERSRSGNRAHVWIFFDRALPATTARKLGSLILTRAMEQRHQLGLDSCQRMRLSSLALRHGTESRLPASATFVRSA